MDRGSPSLSPDLFPIASRCDACGDLIEGEPGGHGLLVFPRGDEVEYEEPPLCERCAHAIGWTALSRYWLEEDDG